MSYTINLTDGTILTTIPDGTLNVVSCSLALPGRNLSGYGAYQNTDLVHLLENFSNGTSPTAPLVGQLWWDTAGYLKVYTGTTSGWKTIGILFNDAAEPTIGNIAGNQWWDSTNNQLKVWDGSDWALIGPGYTSAQGLSGIEVSTVTDAGAGTHTIVSVYNADNRVAVFSNSSAFTPNTAITGFAQIYPGLTLSSNVTGVTGAKLWGTAQNADTLNGYNANTFAFLSGATFTDSVAVQGNLLVGSGNVFVANVSSGTVSLFNNSNNGNIIIKSNIGGTLTNSLVVFGANGILETKSILPQANITHDLGSSTLRFSTVFANVANLTTINSDTINITGNINVLGGTAFGSALGIPSGGTGRGTLTANALLLGNGTTAVQLVSPGNSGNVLLSSGNTWVSGQITTTQFALKETTISLSSEFTGGGNLSANITISANSGYNSYGARTISTSTPTGGNNGDIWYRVT